MKRLGKRVYNNNFFKYWGNTVPLKNNLLFFSKNRIGSTVVNKIDGGGDGELLYNPLTDVIDLAKYGYDESLNGSIQQVLTIPTADGDVDFKIIRTVDDLNNVRSATSDNYILANNIDLSPETIEGDYVGEWNETYTYSVDDIVKYSDNKYYTCTIESTTELPTNITYWEIYEGWSPIGDNTTSLNMFSGTFSGNGKIISNLLINNSSLNYASLFSYNIGIISNLNVSDINITCKRFTGGVCGYNYSKINNCRTSGSIVCSERAGGIAGYQNEITSYIATTSNCYSTCRIDGTNYIGGVVGINQSTNSIIENCYYAGELVTSKSGITSINNGTVTSSYWDIEISGATVSAGGVGKTTNEMKLITPSTIYTDWDFSNTWIIDDGYPYLRMQVDKIANPISNSRIVNNYDGYILMPSDIEIESGKPLFNRDDTDIYNQDATSVETGYVGDGTGGESSYYWHISELNTATILSYMNNDYKNSWFVKNTFDGSEVKTIKEILAYNAPTTDAEDLAKIMKYLGIGE